MVISLLLLAIGFSTRNILVGIGALIVFIFSARSFVMTIIGILTGIILYYLSLNPAYSYLIPIAVFMFAVLLIVKNEKGESSGEGYNPSGDLSKLLGGL